MVRYPSRDVDGMRCEITYEQDGDRRYMDVSYGNPVDGEKPVRFEINLRDEALDNTIALSCKDRGPQVIGTVKCWSNSYRATKIDGEESEFADLEEAFWYIVSQPLQVIFNRRDMLDALNELTGKPKV